MDDDRLLESPDRPLSGRYEVRVYRSHLLLQASGRQVGRCFELCARCFCAFRVRHTTKAPNVTYDLRLYADRRALERIIIADLTYDMMAKGARFMPFVGPDMWTMFSTVARKNNYFCKTVLLFITWPQSGPN